MIHTIIHKSSFRTPVKSIFAIILLMSLCTQMHAFQITIYTNGYSGNYCIHELEEDFRYKDHTYDLAGNRDYNINNHSSVGSYPSWNNSYISFNVDDSGKISSILPPYSAKPNAEKNGIIFQVVDVKIKVRKYKGTYRPEFYAEDNNYEAGNLKVKLIKQLYYVIKTQTECSDDKKLTSNFAFQIDSIGNLLPDSTGATVAKGNKLCFNSTKLPEHIRNLHSECSDVRIAGYDFPNSARSKKIRVIVGIYKYIESKDSCSVSECLKF